MVAANQLASEFGLRLIGNSVEILHVAMSTDQVVPGSLFIAVQGAKRHGIEFIASAIRKGAVAVLTDSQPDQHRKIPFLIHRQPREIAGLISARVLGNPAQALQLFGITGTNGKTSTASYLQKILELCEKPTGLSASTGRFLADKVLPSSLTSPEVTELHELLAQMVATGSSAAVIEVSAQALIRNRVDGVLFEVVGFTNLSRDHLDDFESMDEYLAAKALLFTPKLASCGVVFMQDDFSSALIESATIPITTVGTFGADWNYSIDQAGQFSISGPKGKLDVVFRYGALMAKNFALAITMALAGGLSLRQLQLALTDFEFQVPGRLERVTQSSPAVFVDYAHTPIGVQAAVAELSARYENLTVILGASGNRDVGKRIEMGRSCQAADLVLITDQHPRDEEPSEIRKLLIEGALQVLSQDKVLEFADPKTALMEALNQTPKSGAILWCGPGNLKYREVAGVKIPFDARGLVKDLIQGD